MNRKKKINQTLKAKAKKANAKKAGQSAGKPKYIAKADRVPVSVPVESAVDVQDIVLKVSLDHRRGNLGVLLAASA